MLVDGANVVAVPADFPSGTSREYDLRFSTVRFKLSIIFAPDSLLADSLIAAISLGK